jgi:hypothetical protein
MDGLLPRLHWRRRCLSWSGGDICAIRGLPASFHDGFDRAENTDEQDREAGQPAGAIRKNVQPSGVAVVMANIGHDIEAETAVRRDALVERGMETWQIGLQIGTFPAGPKAQIPGKISWIALAMLLFPERGAPFRMMIWPGWSMRLLHE